MAQALPLAQRRNYQEIKTLHEQRHCLFTTKTLMLKNRTHQYLRNEGASLDNVTQMFLHFKTSSGFILFPPRATSDLLTKFSVQLPTSKSCYKPTLVPNLSFFSPPGGTFSTLQFWSLMGGSLFQVPGAAYHPSAPASSQTRYLIVCLKDLHQDHHPTTGL